MRPREPSGIRPPQKRTNWPERVGIDEHFFKRGKGFEGRRFVTMVVDQTNGRLIEVANGKAGADVDGGRQTFWWRKRALGVD